MAAPGLPTDRLGFKLGDVLVGLKAGTENEPEALKTTLGRAHVLLYSWNPDTLAWEVATTGGEGAGLEVQVTNAALGLLATRLDVASDTVTYVGKASPGAATSSAAWMVYRMTSNAEGDLVIEYADGNSSFDNVWDNRASLSYS